MIASKSMTLHCHLSRFRHILSFKSAPTFAIHLYKAVIDNKDLHVKLDLCVEFSTTCINTWTQACFKRCRIISFFFQYPALLLQLYVKTHNLSNKIVFNEYIKVHKSTSHCCDVKKVFSASLRIAPHLPYMTRRKLVTIT